MTKQNQLVVYRDQLVACSSMAMAIMDDETATERARLDALRLFEQLKYIMLYQEAGADGERLLCLVPTAFQCKDFYKQRVEETLLDLGERVVGPVGNQPRAPKPVNR